MGFLAAAAPWIAQLAPIALSMLGGRGGQSKEASNSLNLLQRAQEKGFGLAERAETAASPLLQSGQQNLNTGARYYQNLLSGNRARFTDALAPEMDQLSENFGSARSAIMGGPRGGGRTSALAQLPGQQAGAATRLLSGVRPGAANALMGAGQTAISSGSGLLNTATQGIYGTNSAANSLLNYDLQRQASDQQRQGAVGSSIFDFIQQLPGLLSGGRGNGAANLGTLPGGNISIPGILGGVSNPGIYRP